MSTSPPPPPTVEPEDLSPAELGLGRVLALIHRVLPWLDDPTQAAEVQGALQRAAAWLEKARAAHDAAAPKTASVGTAHRVSTGVEPEIAAAIAAAVAMLMDRPYRLVSVQPAAIPTPYLNVWAVEGRTQIFQSHKVR